MQRLEVSCAVRHIYMSLLVKGLMNLGNRQMNIGKKDGVNAVHAMKACRVVVV
jgi:hypothetical protein